jgi:hypothetical protein
VAGGTGAPWEGVPGSEEVAGSVAGALASGMAGFEGTETEVMTPECMGGSAGWASFEGADGIGITFLTSE